MLRMLQKPHDSELIRVRRPKGCPLSLPMRSQESCRTILKWFTDYINALLLHLGINQLVAFPANVQMPAYKLLKSDACLPAGTTSWHSTLANALLAARATKLVNSFETRMLYSLGSERSVAVKSLSMPVERLLKCV